MIPQRRTRVSVPGKARGGATQLRWQEPRPSEWGRREARTLMMLSGARFMFRFLILPVSWWAVLQVRRYLLISSLGNLVPSKCFSPRANKLREDPWPQSRRPLFCGTCSPRSSPQPTPQGLHASSCAGQWLPTEIGGGYRQAGSTTTQTRPGAPAQVGRGQTGGDD